MYENVLTACDLSPLSAWRADSSFNSPQPESVFTVQSSCFRSDISDRSACRSRVLIATMETSQQLLH